MKIMFCIAVWILASQASFANEKTYTTTTGAVFTQIESSLFGKAWRSPNGLVWSADIGQFSNKSQTAIAVGEITDSPAAVACQRIGGRLPTVKEYEALTSNFDLESNGVLISDKGRVDLYSIFPEVQTHNYWSSTTDGGGILYVFYRYGVINCWSGECISAQRSVRCVAN